MEGLAVLVQPKSGKRRKAGVELAGLLLSIANQSVTQVWRPNGHFPGRPAKSGKQRKRRLGEIVGVWGNYAA